MSSASSTAQSGAANQNNSAPASASERARQTVEGIGDNPVALLAGGVALGVLVGVLLPRAAKERELLDPLGRTLAQRATAAAQAAKEAGRQEIESLVPDRNATKERVTALFGNILDAAKTAGQQA
ncbi:hypothetical protein MZO42_05040 [Sphingomonas psychrotolerans]|uniref:YtxH domain-containing protein n=1 Tax=Sphingomonas psychrotolerans TaxID=1327635 RepID=A0ABU3N0I2_9SPHN|nr:hypothetical protein [Sphingomonas psychrotolerans]MDT8758055.1 hypothetical protein [Sphingomonas psychrotolerans]